MKSWIPNLCLYTYIQLKRGPDDGQPWLYISRTAELNNLTFGINTKNTSTDIE